MAINPLAAAASTPSAASAAPDAMGKQEFLQILMMQLKNQDPLNPMNDREFIAQMAQLSTLEATQSLSGQIHVLTTVQQQTQALQYVGHEVGYLDANGNPAAGKVTAVRLDTAPPTLFLGDVEIPTTWVQTVL